MTTWVRYSTATGQIYEAAFYEVRAAATNEAVVIIETTALPNSRTEVLDPTARQLRAATGAELASFFPSAPDVDGFIEDLKRAFPRTRLRQVVDAVMVMTIIRGGFDDLKVDIDAAKAENRITLAEHTQVRGFGRARNFPGW